MTILFEISHNVHLRVSFSPAKALELTETDGSGKKNTTEEISLHGRLKIQRCKHFPFHVVHIVEWCWMPAFGHGEITK